MQGQTPKDPWSVVTPQITPIHRAEISRVIRCLVADRAGSGARRLRWRRSAGWRRRRTRRLAGPDGVGAWCCRTDEPRPRAATVTPVSAPQGGGTIALVPAVTGAPGDGATSLTICAAGRTAQERRQPRHSVGRQHLSRRRRSEDGHSRRTASSRSRSTGTCATRKATSSAPCRRRTRSRKARSTALGARRPMPPPPPPLRAS